MILSQTSRKYASRFEEKFGALDPMAKDLLRKLLSMDPDKRLSADEALDHEYFWSDPVPATPEQLPKYPPSHEFTAKKRRQQSQQPAAQQQQQQPLPGQHSMNAPAQQLHHHPSQMHRGVPPAGGGQPHLPFP